MTAIVKSIHEFEDKFENSAEGFAFHHPRIAFLAMFVGMPLFMLMAVALFTTLFTLPVAWIFEWM